MKNPLGLTLKLAIFCVLVAPLASCNASNSSSNPTTSPSPSPSPTASILPASPPPASPATPQAKALSLKGAILAKKGTDNKLSPVKDGIFKRGENVHLVLVDVGKFKKGTDGKNWLDMDMVVTNAQGQVVLSKEKLLGDGGKVALPNDVAGSPFGTVNTKPQTAAGTYKVKLTVYDRIGGGQISETKSFTLK